ncbi:MAG: hypothetical protein KY447_05850 [Actinobacteria bacterium]|nr:hypothetical protein [Actinomycetota bacterium]MBW3642421.1 hypothetical protein [Actinomycetota bacterium]
MATFTLSPLALAVRLHVSMLLASTHAIPRLRRLRDERGQTSAEYALVLLGAATVALLITAWATKTGKLGQLLDKIFDSVTGKVK